jgi:hypothetical protein
MSKWRACGFSLAWKQGFMLQCGDDATVHRARVAVRL